MGTVCPKGDRLERIDDQVKAIGLNDVLPGISFPEDFAFMSRLMMAHQYDLKASITKFGTPSAETLVWATKNIQGKERTPENYKMLHDKMLSYFGISHQKFVPGYRFFPEDISFKDLEMLVKHNSFMTSFLTIHDGKPCIDCLPAGTGESMSFLQTFVDALPQEDLVRFRVVFDADLKFEKVNFYRLKDSKWQEVTIESEQDQYSKVFATTRYAFQCLHATIHIFQGFVTAAMFSAAQTADDDVLSAWLDPVVQNVLVKMEDVIMLLIGSVFPSFLIRWMHADRAKVLNGMKKFLSVLGNVKSEAEYYDTFLFKGIPAGHALREKLLPDFRQHTALVPGYAKAVAKYFNERKEVSLSAVEGHMSTFLRQCCSGPNIFGLAKLEHWIIAQACAGLTHGNTLSLTRVDLVEAVIGAGAPDNTFTKDLVIEELTGFGTMMGIVADRSVFAAPDKQNLPDDLKSIMVDIEYQAQELKVACQAANFDNEETMRNFGWIITDYFPDLYDHKQLTLTTYV